MRKKQEQYRGTNRNQQRNSADFVGSSHRADTMELPKLDIAPPVRYSQNGTPQGQPPRRPSTNRSKNAKGKKGEVTSLKPPVQYKNREEQRKAENAKRKKKKKIRGVMLSLFLTALVIAICAGLFYGVLFKITTIKVEKNTLYTDKQVLTVIDVSKGDNLYAFSKNKLIDDITTNCPYIRDVDVKRNFPDGLVLTVKEDKAKYAYKYDGNYVLLNDKLKVLENSVEKAPNNIITISDLKFKETQLGKVVTFTDEKSQKRMETMLKSIAKSGIKDVTQITMKSSANNSITYDNRIVIKLGSIDDLEYRLKFAMKSIEQLDTENPNVKGVLDMTVDKYGYFTPNQ